VKSLARWCYRRRWTVLLLWIVAFIVIGGVSGALKPSYSEDFKLPNTESANAVDLITTAVPSRSGESTKLVFHAKSGTLDDPSNRTAIEKLQADIAAIPHVTSVGNVYVVGQDAAVSTDRTIGFSDIQLDIVGSDVIEPIGDMLDLADSTENEALQVELSGEIVKFVEAGPGGIMEHLHEIIGVVAAAVVLYIAFRSVFTMFLPLLCAGLAIGIGVSIVGLLTHVYDIPEFAPMLATLIGLGVGIDYALFIVSRHRSNLQQGHSPEESIITAINTSGRAVLFAGITVCIGICGLLLLGVSFLYGLSLSVVSAVLLTMLASVTLLPAMLGFVGMRALSTKQRAELAANGPVDSAHDISVGWSKWARFVQRNKFVMATLALVVMLVLAIPAASIRLGVADAGGDRPGTTTRAAYDLLVKGFGPGFNGPLQVVGDLKDSSEFPAFEAVVDRLRTQPNVASVTPAMQIPGTNVAMAQLYPGTTPQAEETTQLIDDLRANVTKPAADDVTVYLSGNVAIMHDFTKVLSDKLPLFIGVVIGLSFILLMAVFRSILIPLVASLMNLLAAAASFGVVVAIFQWGWGADVFGIEQTGPIMAFLPVMAFAILFGLSMDYEVFLVSRMYEEWHHTNDNDEAVALGQAETGRVITAAGAIMVAIFVAFVFGDDSTIKLFGIALASAVFLDAAIIRTILVPALMNIIGKANWYLPKSLDKALPRVNVESGDD
jgi:RND superfamily putative drug exporter